MATHSNHHDTPPAESAPNRAMLVVSLIGFAAIALIAFAVYQWWPQRLPQTSAATPELVKFVASDQFNNLTRKQQEEYVESLLGRGFHDIALGAMQANMTPEQRQRGLDNAMEAGMNVRWGKHLDAWLKLDAKGKADYVKKVAEQMPKRPPGFDPRGTGRTNRFMTPERQKRFIEGMQPDRRASMAEFMQQLRQANGDGGK